jgi:hypothetical protein
MSLTSLRPRERGDGQAQVPAGGPGRHPGGARGLLLAEQDAADATTPEAATSRRNRAAEPRDGGAQGTFP